MQKILDNSAPLVDMVWRSELDAQKLDSPEAIAGLKSRIFTVLAEIKHDGVRAQYKTALLGMFDKQFGRPKWTPGRKVSWDKTRQKASKSQEAGMQPDALRRARERRVLGAIIEWPDLLEHIDQTLFSLEFYDADMQNLQNTVLNYLQETISVDKRALHAHIEGEGQGKVLAHFRRDRNLTMAAMGGADAKLKQRVQVWQEEARALESREGTQSHATETRTRMVDTIVSENKDALNRLMRSARSERKLSERKRPKRT